MQFADNAIGDAGAEALGSKIATHPTLIYLDLSSTHS